MADVSATLSRAQAVFAIPDRLPHLVESYRGGHGTETTSKGKTLTISITCSGTERVIGVGYRRVASPVMSGAWRNGSERRPDRVVAVTTSFPTRCQVGGWHGYRLGKRLILSSCSSTRHSWP
jgi:hypothetical protein